VPIQHSPRVILQAGRLTARALKASCADCVAALVNAGALRGGLPEGAVSYAVVANMFWPNTTVATLDLTGEALKRIFERSVENSSDPITGTNGIFLQISGMRVVWSPSAVADGNDQNAIIKNMSVGPPFTELISNNRLYRVAVTSDVLKFIRNVLEIESSAEPLLPDVCVSNCGAELLSSVTNVTETEVAVADVLASYLAAQPANVTAPPVDGCNETVATVDSALPYCRQIPIDDSLSQPGSSGGSSSSADVWVP
jgi:2',3'-cyclic-nucleotide 2'-phosphodiesterase (5'-nucleotidase family)